MSPTNLVIKNISVSVVVITGNKSQGWVVNTIQGPGGNNVSVNYIPVLQHCQENVYSTWSQRLNPECFVDSLPSAPHHEDKCFTFTQEISKFNMHIMHKINWLLSLKDNITTHIGESKPVAINIICCNMSYVKARRSHRMYFWSTVDCVVHELWHIFTFLSY